MPQYTAQLLSKHHRHTTWPVIAPWAPTSVAYFCQGCGDIWARVMVSGEGRPQPFLVTYAPCPQHRCSSALDWGIPGGSLIADRSFDPLPSPFAAINVAVLPEAVLAKEVELSLDHYQDLS